LIDIPMSNCIHAGIEKIAILTQFNSASLHRHIWSAYRRDIFSPGWVQILAAEQTPLSHEWYQGTADAVRKQLIEIKEADTQYVLILAADHLYRMDYHKFIDHHVSNGADVTIAVQPVGRDVASALGILKLDEAQRVISFHEKPQTEAELAMFRNSANPDKPFLASMGIYVFNTAALVEMLDEPGNDFGRDLIPAAIGKRNVFGYVFDGYWEDIGTLRRFYEVNLHMAAPDAPFDFYDADHPIYTRARFLPGSLLHDNARLTNVMVADGCRIESADVRNSIVGLRSVIGAGADIRDSIIMGADYYETAAEQADNAREGIPNIGIGVNTRIQRAIIDKNARIGRNVMICGNIDRPDEEHEHWVVRDGIVVVTKNGVIADDTVI
jgi:glucose-1-phosphate adenylyltransferase